MRTYLLYRLADVISRTLPRKFGYWISLRIADMFYRFSRAERSKVISNLRRILAYRGVAPGEETLERLARRVFQHFGKYLVDFFRFSSMTAQEAKRLVSIEHPENLLKAREMGKGILIVTAHLGNWELAGAVLAALGYPPRAVVLPERLKRLNDFFQKRRRGRGMKLIPHGRAVRGIMEALKKNEAVALLADREFSTRNDYADFFGRPARLPRGPAWLAVKTGAPIVPLFLLRQPDDTFLFRIYPPIQSGADEGIEEVRCRIRDILEAEIGAHPEQWFIFDDFWQHDVGPVPADGKADSSVVTETKAAPHVS